MSHNGACIPRGREICALLVACFLLLHPALSQAADAKSKSAIEQVLNSQTRAWNRGDSEGFMAGYWHSPNLVFQSNSVVTHGWQPTMERYRQRYKSAGKEMGHLDFPDQQIVLLGKDAALIRGTWHLRFSNSKESHGLYTLIMRKLPEGWRIIHDHSSSD